MIWKPNVTVAAVLEQDGKFLLVEEETTDGIRLNQPAGHLEPDESLPQGAVRETLEESGYSFRPEWLVGIYGWRHPAKDVTYLRFAFSGTITGHDPGRPLDSGILRAVWLGPDEIRAHPQRHRSPLVLRCVEDCLAGRRFPLDLLTDFD
jgi:8-oxo-dGTP pyrophosphatase MutT (NUDIX family)